MCDTGAPQSMCVEAQRCAHALIRLGVLARCSNTRAPTPLTHPVCCVVLLLPRSPCFSPSTVQTALRAAVAVAVASLAASQSNPILSITSPANGSVATCKLPSHMLRFVPPPLPQPHIFNYLTNAPPTSHIPLTDILVTTSHHMQAKLCCVFVRMQQL